LNFGDFFKFDSAESLAMLKAVPPDPFDGIRNPNVAWTAPREESNDDRFLDIHKKTIPSNRKMSVPGINFELENGTFEERLAVQLFH
jgi:hypothetical protein